LFRHYELFPKYNYRCLKEPEGFLKNTLKIASISGAPCYQAKQLQERPLQATARSSCSRRFHGILFDAKKSRKRGIKTLSPLYQTQNPITILRVEQCILGAVFEAGYPYKKTGIIVSKLMALNAVRVTWRVLRFHACMLAFDCSETLMPDSDIFLEQSEE